MVSIRKRPRKDGTICYAVLYSSQGRQSSLPFDDEKSAEAFRQLIDVHGATRALEMYGLEATPRRREERNALTVTEWLDHHISHLSGVEPRTTSEYRGMVRKDIAPVLGHIPLGELSREDIANKHGLLSSALNAAVQGGYIGFNPAAGARLPRTERPEMRFLTREEFALFAASVTEYWRSMVRFLVASGVRLSEATALRAGDINRADATVRISRSWKRGPGGYQLGPPKTRKSVRTINVPAAVLDDLNYDKDWIFTNPGVGNRAAGGPVRPASFRANVWWPAAARAGLAPPRPRIHDLRHTCASWLIMAGIPLPVIQQHLGHESINTTVGLYGHIDRSSHQAAADVIGKMLT